MNTRLDSNENIQTELSFCSKIRDEGEGTTELIFGQLVWDSIEQVQISEVWTRQLRQTSRKLQECTAVKQKANTLVYFSLISNDSARLVLADFATGKLKITLDTTMPYKINFSPDLNRNTILTEKGDMVIVAIDTKLAGGV